MKTNVTLMRLRGILRKEFLQIIRDPSSIALAIVMPIVLLFLFGYGVSLDADHIPVAVIADDQSSASLDLQHRFALSTTFSVAPVATMPEAEEMLDAHRIDAIIHIPDNFSTILHRRQASPVQLIINGVDANRARLIQGYVRSVVASWAVYRQDRSLQADAGGVTLNQRIWFNEEAASRNFLVPGLITLIMTLIGILLTALVVAREWERGTMEAMLVTPLRRLDILIGKLVPYYLLGMIGMGLSVAVGVLLFGVPFRGSFMALFLLSSLFMLASLGFGLLLSSAIKIQFVAAQVSIIAGFMPAFFLSGLLFDLTSTPRVIQTISYIVPARYFVAISHTLFMAGDIWSVLLPNGLILALMAALFLLLAYRKISKHLEG